MSGPAAPIHALLAGGIDYAGLFPPAALSMDDAVARYAEYRASADRWALGRFVVPAARLEELVRAARPFLQGGDPWPLAVTAAPPLGPALAAIEAAGVAGQVDTLEFRADTVALLAEAIPLVPPSVRAFAEPPLTADPAPFVAVLTGTPVSAKLRTGGVVPEAIPPVERVLGWLEALVAAGVPFKCTAGLHHPVRGNFPLTYAADSPAAVMHGYLNVMLAAALLAAGGSRPEAGDLLLESDPAALAVEEEGVRWRHRFFTIQELERLRASGFVSFGSCSFREPLDEVTLLHVS